MRTLALCKCVHCADLGTRAQIDAWGGIGALAAMISRAVNDWQERVCVLSRGTSTYYTAFVDYSTMMPQELFVQPGSNTRALLLLLTHTQTEANAWRAIQGRAMAGPALTTREHHPSNVTYRPELAGAERQSRPHISSRTRRCMGTCTPWPIGAQCTARHCHPRPLEGAATLEACCRLWIRV